MPNLKEWRQKPSWHKTLPICPMYFLNDIREKDTDFRTILKQMDSPVLNLTEGIGFDGINLDWMDDEIPAEKRYLTQPMQKLDSMPLNELLDRIIRTLKDYIAELWDPSKFHIFFMSGGKDSRLIGYLLAQLRDERGKDWLGELHIRTTEDEAPIFKEVVKRQGWKREQWSIYREGTIDSEEYYPRLRSPDENPNGFWRSNVDFFHDIIEERKLDWGNVQLLTGNIATETLDYPGRFGAKDISNPFGLLRGSYAIGLRMFLTWYYSKFGDILTPYLGYDVLDFVFRIPAKFHKKVILANEQEQTFISIEMLKHFNDEGPFVSGHKYNFGITKARQKQILEWWKNSDFYKRYSDNQAVRKVDPTKFEFANLDDQLFNLAITYQGVMS